MRLMINYFKFRKHDEGIALYALIQTKFFSRFGHTYVWG